MITQIYEVSTPREASTLSELGVDHVGVLVGNGAFPREQPIDAAAAILAAIKLPSKASILFLTADLDLIVAMGSGPAAGHRSSGRFGGALEPRTHAAREGPRSKCYYHAKHPRCR